MLDNRPARRVAIAGVVGALYVVLSLAVAPFASVAVSQTVLLLVGNALLVRRI